MSKHFLCKSGRKCQLSGKKATKGWNYSFLRSHFNPTSKRRFEVNLHEISTRDENGTPCRVKVAANVIKRCPEIRLGINNYIKRGKVKRLKGQHKKALLHELGLLKGEE
ncbi:MAG: L28 family ribosomal protein [Candidatus Caenarcaniphilales bacterium]|nr:L28 family ribosomal protein [Candidatus Caenarcaniphilales bacterium]